MAEDQIYEQDQVATGDPDPLEKLYNTVSEQGLYTKSFDEFKKKYSDSAEREKLFKVVSEQGLYTKSKADFDAKYFGQPVQAPKFELLRKMPSTSGSSESTSVSGTMAASMDRAAKAKPTQSAEEKLVKDLDKAQKTLKHAVDNNDEVLADVIREGRYIAASQQGLDKQFGGARSDMPGTPAPDLGRMGQPEVKPQDQPVTAKDIEEAKAEVNNNPQYARHLIKKVVENDPEKGKELQAALYLEDANQSAQQDPNGRNRLTKIMQNAEKVKTGEYQYNPTAARLERPEGFLDGVITGLRERTKQMGDYKTYQQDDATVIKILEEELNRVDDEPVPVPAGVAGEFGSMLGMEGVAMAKSGAATAITGAIPGGQGAAPFVGAAVSAPEYYERGYATALKETYAKLRAEGKSPEEALATARAQARDEGKYSAAEGAVSAAIGGRIGLRPLPKFNFTGSFAKAANNVLKQTIHYGKEATLDGLTDGLVAGYLQEEKNIAAKEKGIHREEGEGIWENIKGELMFSLGVAGVTKAGKLTLDPKTYQTLLRNVANQDEQEVDKALGNMVVEGKITPEDAAQTKKDIQQQKTINQSIPEDVAEKSAVKIQEKIEQRNELEKEMEKADKAFHPEIKEKIKQINEDIVELAKDKEPVADETKETKATETVRVPETKAAPVAERTPEEKQAEDFRKHVIDTLPAEEGGLSAHFDIPGMKPSEAKKAAADIRAGKNTAGAKRLQKAMDEILESGMVPFIQSAGGLSQRMGVPLADYMKVMSEPAAELTPEESDFAEQIPQDTADIINFEGITPQNLESFKQQLFSGFPYTEAEYNEIKEYFTETAGTAEDQADAAEGAPAQGTEEISEADEIDTPEALKSELAKLFTQSKAKEGVDKFGKLPKIGAASGNTTRPKGEDIKQYTPTSIIEQAKEFYKGDPLIEKVSAFLEPIIKANPNIRIDHDAKVQDNVLGFSHSDGTIELNFDRLQDHDSLYRTALHEMVHAATRYEISSNTKLRQELRNLLDEARKALDIPQGTTLLKALADKGAINQQEYMAIALSVMERGGYTAKENEDLLSRAIDMDVIDKDLYGTANELEMLAEVFTNQKFYDALKEVKYKGDSLLRRIILAIAKFLSEKYKQIAQAKEQVDADNLADYLIQFAEAAFTGQQGEDTEGALPAKGKTPPTQEELIKRLIKRTSKKISDDQLRDEIVGMTGLDPNLVQQWIDEIRKPPVPPPPTFTTGELSPQERNLSLKKFDQLFSEEGPKEPSGWEKFLTKFKNASAWIDNPYRFITKISEDIDKEYSLPRKSAIPLGRAFEKNAAGRAALKVQAFVNEVLVGKIGKNNYGRIKGEKFEDFQKYLAAKRVIDRLQTERKKRKAGEDVNRSTGNITEQDAEVLIEELRAKYADKSTTLPQTAAGPTSGTYGPSAVMDEFEARADAFQKHMDTMLQTLLGAGIISKESYDQMKADNNFYAPFNIIQEKLLANQDGQPVGIQGIVKRIKGMDPELPTTKTKALEFMNVLAQAVKDKVIQPEEYFRVSLIGLNNLKYLGKISQEEFDNMVAQLELPGFYLGNIIDAAANMIYKAEGMALKNTMMQRLYELKQYDKEGKFIQDVDGFQPQAMKGGDVVMVPKRLTDIAVEPGMAPVKLMLDGKPKFIAVNEQAAKKLNTLSNYETHAWMQGVDLINRLFRAFVITTSPGFQIKNFAIDFIRTAMLSRYGLFAGKGLVEPLVNALLYVPQHIEALGHSALGNVGIKTKAFKQWMESDSFSRGMFDNLFDNERRVKEMTATRAKSILSDFLQLKFIAVPGSILEQTHKLAIYQRGQAVEGLKPEMLTAMLSSKFNRNINPNMNKYELRDAIDKIDYEVQNEAGSPNFPQTHKLLKIASIFLQFFSARVKGEATDYRRTANIFLGRGEGVPLSKQETIQMALQFTTIAGVIGAYAVKNILDDDDEEQFDSVPSYQRDNYLNIPSGTFEFQFDDGSRATLRDYIKIPLRGLTATMNVFANSAVKFYKRHNLKELKQAGLKITGNASPVNLHGDDQREIMESSVSNLTPVFKFFMEYAFNRDTHKHRDIIPDSYGDRSMLSQYRAWVDSTEPDLAKRPGIAPWDVKVKSTPEWAVELSKFLYDNLGIEVAAITLDQMENTMGNPTELYNNAIEKTLRRSKSKYPVSGASGKVVEPEEETTQE